MESPIKLAVIFGGMSSEYEVSQSSAAGVLRNTDTSKYDIYPIGITKEGKWLLYCENDWDKIADGSWIDSPSNIPAVISPDRDCHGLILSDGQRIRIDVVFPVMHGKYCEDGAIQGLFELSGIPYVGCDVASSANCMNKIYTKIFADREGITQAKWTHMFSSDFLSDVEGNTQRIIEFLGLPIFVKPASTGSSVGISKVKTAKSLEDAVKEATLYDKRIVFEENITGQEVEVAVLGSLRKQIASSVGEIIPAQEFYTYSAKYHDAQSETLIPARLSPEVSDELKRLALRVFNALGCSGLSRVDFFVRNDREIIFNEINTLPGFTPISMYTKLFGYDGISYSKLIDRLIELALSKENN
ncbi:MAG: D-alanine--D-alanine ligase [Clostridiales bacterium]|nr:D-alanine--D-alanine ligase [Clostridiales bacterium]